MELNILRIRLTKIAHLGRHETTNTRSEYYCPRVVYFDFHCSEYRSGTVNSNTVNSKFHLIRSYCEVFSYHFPNISCLKCTVNLNFHLIQSKTLRMNVFELTVPNLCIEDGSLKKNFNIKFKGEASFTF